jgi:uncharacterized protein YecT (DUF1311 family)
MSVGIIVISIGLLMILMSIGGFVDTRKVDRRFKTGYRNNEPDTRDFGRAGKTLLYGIGVCLVGGAINSFFGSKSNVSESTVVQPQEASRPHTVQARDRDVIAPTDKLVSARPVPAQDTDPIRNTRSSDADTQDTVLNRDSRARQSRRSDTATGFAASERSVQFYLTGFDCARAMHDDELTVCGDAGLAAMDRHLGKLYNSTLNVISDPQALRRSQAEWMVTRQKCAKDVDCLRRVYGERIGQFTGSLGSKPLLAVEESRSSKP